MAKSETTLRVPIGTTDEQLVQILEEVLPDVLIRKMQISPVRARQAARELAHDIVRRARQCSESHLVSEVARHIQLKPPSKEQCEAFKEALDEVLVIRYVEQGPRRTGAVRTAAGKLWKLLKEDTLGIESKDEYTGNVAGPRG